MKPISKLSLSLIYVGVVCASAQAATVNSPRQNLNGDECTNLGGEIKKVNPAICESGKFCRRIGTDGKIYRVCLEKNAKLKNLAKPQFSSRPGKPGDGNAPIVGKVKRAGVVTGVPLTIEECEGLGGVVAPSHKECGALWACSTTDRHGVIRVVCIDEVAR